MWIYFLLGVVAGSIICAITIIGEIVYMIYIGEIVTTIKSKFSKKKSD